MREEQSFHYIARRGAAEEHRSPRVYWVRGLLASAILSGCVADAHVSRSAAPRADAPVQQTAYTPPPARVYSAPVPSKVAPMGLRSAISALGRNFNGIVGISVRRVDADWDVAYNGSRLMPQQSVSKLWVGMTMLDAVDRGKLTLKDPVKIDKDDLTLFHQPLAAMVKSSGYTTDITDLFTRAMQHSDNTANDSILRTVGGPQAVRGFLARRFIPDVRFGPGERLLQSKTAGLVWDQKMSLGRNFYTARANLPRSVREKALDDYLTNPPDGAAPSSITLALAKLKRGEMLSPASTAYLISTMNGAKTGPQRIKGGVPAGWSYGHKTGTGQVLYARSTGYNDVGIMTAPDGTSYAVAVMIASTSVSIPERWELMQGVARAVAANHVPNR
ncbi:MAG: serine hydrolase [Sphingobium sp.]|nr:serine hydrolase [Sphingobium sp.]MCP5398627.1 serine hydrolase [Sphingomonas sp.]